MLLYYNTAVNCCFCDKENGKFHFSFMLITPKDAQHCVEYKIPALFLIHLYVRFVQSVLFIPFQNFLKLLRKIYPFEEISILTNFSKRTTFYARQFFPPLQQPKIYKQFSVFFR